MEQQKLIIWLLGAHCAGKTHNMNLIDGMYEISYALDKSKRGDVHVLRIGSMLREMFTVQDFIADSNPFATTFAEETVLNLLNTRIQEFIASKCSVLVIDSSPRTKEQFEVLRMYSNMSHVVILHEHLDTRKERSLKIHGDASFFNARSEHEISWFSLCHCLCLDERIPLTYVHSDDFPLFFEQITEGFVCR